MASDPIRRRIDPFEEQVMNASSAQVAGALGAVFFCLLGLLGYVADVMAAAAAVTLGTGFALNAGLLAAQRSTTVQGAHGTPRGLPFSSGVEAVTGLAAIVLGILALLDVHMPALTPMAALALGLGMISSSNVLARLNDAPALNPEKESTEAVIYSIVVFASAVHIVVGTGAIALAGLALSGYSPKLFALTALLALALTSTLSGVSVVRRMRGVSSAH